MTGELSQLEENFQKIWESQTSPIVLDLIGSGGTHQLLTAFAGTSEDVAWQLDQLENLQLVPADAPVSTAGPFVSVPTNKVFEKIRSFKRYTARLGNGVIYSEEVPQPVLSPGVIQLNKRLKDTFDPKGILPRIKL